MSENIPLVSIVCNTYNHKDFIRDAIEGFLMQKTTFPIEILIHDDASTDGTADIVREYERKHPNLIFPIYQSENQYSKGNRPGLINRSRARGKYIALCEGDDYWTDPLKLQKQVDFLEENEGYVATAENGIVKNLITNQSYLFSEEPERDLTLQELVIKRRFPTASVMFRTEVINELHLITKMSYDTLNWCFLASKGKFRYFTNVSSVYNRGIQGVVEGTDKLRWAKIVEAWNLELIRLFADKYFEREIALNNIWTHYWALYEEKNYKNFSQKVFILFKCLKYNTKATIKEYDNLGKTKIKRRIKDFLKIMIKKPATRGRLRSQYHKLVEIFNKKRRKIPSFYKKPDQPGITTKGRTPKLIVSLTTYPARIKQVHFTLQTLLNQTVKPDKIILWLAESQFPRKEKELPGKILKLRKFGLTIDWCDDIKSYKKLIPALNAYPDDIIVTADDDIFYPEKWLELLFSSYTMNKDIIHCHRAHRIQFDQNGNILPYNQWDKNNDRRDCSFFNFFTTGGGVLFPPNSLHPDVLRRDLFINLAPIADDIWSWAMAVKTGTKTKLIKDNYPVPIIVEGTDKETLWAINQLDEGNDKQLKLILNKYPEIIERLHLELKSTQFSE